MARMEITPTAIKKTGVYLAKSAGIADGHKFTNEGRTWAEVANSHATLARSVTFITTQQVDGLNVEDLIVSIPALSTRLIGVFARGTFNKPDDPDKGMVYVNYDAGNEADLSIAVYAIDRADIVV